MIKPKNGRRMLLSKCAACDSKKSRFIKENEAKGLLSSLGLKTPLNNSIIRRHFALIYIWYKMNEIVNNYY